MLLRSSRIAKAISKTAGIGSALLGAGKWVGKSAIKHPMKATGLGLGGLAVGGSAIAAGKNIAKGMKTPTPQALAKRRMEGFGNKATESAGDAQGRAFGTAIGGVQRVLGR